MTDDVDAVLERARGRVDPDPDERAALEATAGELRERAESAVANLPVEAAIVRVGSTARNTWVSGDRDIDLFVRFPPELDRDKLREYGLAVGHEVLPDGREEYAEHPYVTGDRGGFDVDVVPCYDVDSATEIRSAVDRTPFHTEYVRERVDDDLAGEIRLAKGFCVGVGVYGSDLRTRGFGGYLLELLVLEYGSCRELLQAVAEWHPPVELDPENHAARSFDDPLAVVDPTDPERNVAAVVSEESLASLQHYARAFLEDPCEELFESGDTDPIDRAALLDHLDRRGTTPVAVRFAAPRVVPDDLYPQLRRSLRGIVSELDRRGFDAVRSSIAVAGDESHPTGSDDAMAGAGDPPDDSVREAILFVELAVDRCPAVERHEGPPVHVADHAAGFCRKYADDPDVYGPFVDGARYVVERPREFETAAEFLESDAIFDVKHGADVEESLRAGYDLLVDEEILELLPAFGRPLAEHFDPTP